MKVSIAFIVIFLGLSVEFFLAYSMGEKDKSKEFTSQIQKLNTKILNLQAQNLDYQIETNLKGYNLYREGTLLGKFKWNERIPLDSVIIADNL